MSKRLTVTVVPDGPLKLDGVEALHYCGEPVEADSAVYLCRCGQSANAPFCDGTHGKVGFSGACERTQTKEARIWEGQTVRTRFDPNICMHVLFCKPLDALRERELAGDAEAAAEIMKVVESCPSGALTWEAKAELPTPVPPASPQVDVVEGGEVRVRGPFDINEPRAEAQPQDRATLCRCGLSKNKPWCDGRHRARTDFR